MEKMYDVAVSSIAVAYNVGPSHFSDFEATGLKTERVGSFVLALAVTSQICLLLTGVQTMSLGSHNSQVISTLR